MPNPSWTGGWLVTIDDARVATGRVALSLNDAETTGISVGASGDSNGISWGNAAITAFLAQEGQWGSSLAGYIVPNRTITIPIGLGMSTSSTAPDPETALRNLSMKVGLLQREGGWLCRQRMNFDGTLGEPMYADIVDAQLTVPDDWMETAGVEPSVTLTLTALPDFYGDELELTTLSGMGFCTGVLTSGGANAVIAGDYPARCRLMVTDQSGNSQNSLIWGLRSRYYSSGVTQKLVYAATDMTVLNGASAVSLSGSQSAEVVKLDAPAANVWVPMLATSLTSGGALNHLGTYRVWARAYSATEAAQLRFTWGSTDAAVPQTNTAAQLPGVGAFYLLDLGVVTLQQPPVGAPNWVGAVEQYCVTSGDDVQIDYLMFEPVAESAGVLIAAPESSGSAVSSAEAAATYASVTGIGTVVWTPSSASASSSPSTGQQTEYLEMTDCGFAIPATATIVGIEVSLDFSARQDYADEDAQMVKAGAIQATNRATGSRVYNGVVTYGGPTDLWGTTWAYSDINSSSFGFAWSVLNTGGGGGGAATVSGCTITVYFTIGAGIGTPTDAVVYASQTAALCWNGIVRTFDGTVYGPVANITGDLPRLPPSGLEDAPVEIFVKPSRSDLSSTPDSAVDAFTVTPYFRPTFLARI